jgi:hypothetical protein
MTNGRCVGVQISDVQILVFKNGSRRHKRPIAVFTISPQDILNFEFLLLNQIYTKLFNNSVG